jgi:hypothetical protein
MNPDPASLDRLHDIISPPPAPWWPPAPGWYWLAGVLAIWTVYWLATAFIRWQRNRYRREALAQLRSQTRLLSDAKMRAPVLANLAELLKRAALSAYPRSEVASLTGSAWLSFLDRQAGMRDFNSAQGALLEKARVWSY